MVLLVVVATELMAYLLLVINDREYSSYATLQEQRSARTAPSQDILRASEALALHPFVGFVLDPDEVNRRFEDRGYTSRVSQLGFSGSREFLFGDTPDDFVIAVTGGSVAAQFVNRHPGMKEVTRAIEARFPEKKVVVYALSVGGYKQPQQYIAVSYLLALGVHFDLVINLDGFNEVALPPAEHIPKQVNPFYPRAWHTRVSGLGDKFTLATAGKISIFRERQVDWASLCSKAPLRYSATANFLWKAYDRWLSMKIAGLEMEFQAHTTDSQQYEASGPAYRYEAEGELYRDLARVWKNSSLQMHRLCEANGIPYFHFLQPNQYVEDSKPMQPDEADVAIEEGHPYITGVVNGYPLLRRAGRELQDAGVNFVDLTMIYKDFEEPVYVDSCCHIGREGNVILGRAMGEAIGKFFDSAQDAGRAANERQATPAQGL